MLTTKESASSRAAVPEAVASDGGGEMDAAPAGESDNGDDVGERPSPRAVDSAEDLRDYEIS